MALRFSQWSLAFLWMEEKEIDYLDRCSIAHVWSRLVWGGRTIMISPISAELIDLVVGGTLLP